MLIAGAIDFVVFIEKRNDYATRRPLRRFVSSVREVTGVDGRVLSSEVFAPGPGRPGGAACPVSCVGRAGPARIRPGRRLGAVVMDAFVRNVAARGPGSAAVGGAGLFAAGRRDPRTAAKPHAAGPGEAEKLAARAVRAARRDRAGRSARSSWLVTGWVGGRRRASALLVLRLARRSAAPRRAAHGMARLEGLAIWTESLRDTIAGAVGLEQAIPASLRVAAPPSGAAGAPGGPVAHPGAAAGRAAPVRRRPGRPERRPDHRGADHQREAARPRPAGPARRAVRLRPRGAGHAQEGHRRARALPGAAVQIVVAISVGLALGMAFFNHVVRAGLRHPGRPAGAGRRRRSLRGRVHLAAQAREVRSAGTAARSPVSRPSDRPRP